MKGPTPKPLKAPSRKRQRILRELFEIVLDNLPPIHDLDMETSKFYTRVTSAALRGDLANDAGFPERAKRLLSEFAECEGDAGLVPRIYLSGVLIGSLGAIRDEGLAKAWRRRRKKQLREFAKHKRGPYIEQKRDRNAKIRVWNEELLTYPSGKRRNRRDRVAEIHKRCQKVYHDTLAEAHSFKFKDGERRAKVWNISTYRIIQIVSLRKNS